MRNVNEGQASFTTSTSSENISQAISVDNRSNNLLTYSNSATAALVHSPSPRTLYYLARRYNLQPPSPVFLINQFLTPSMSATVSSSQIPLRPEQTRSFYTFSVNRNGGFVRQYHERVFDCTICNTGPVRDLTAARRHHQANHKTQEFHDTTFGRRRTKWRSELFPDEESKRVKEARKRKNDSLEDLGSSKASRPSKRVKKQKAEEGSEDESSDEDYEDYYVLAQPFIWYSSRPGTDAN